MPSNGGGYRSFQMTILLIFAVPLLFVPIPIPGNYRVANSRVAKDKVSVHLKVDNTWRKTTVGTALGIHHISSAPLISHSRSVVSSEDLKIHFRAFKGFHKGLDPSVSPFSDDLQGNLFPVIYERPESNMVADLDPQGSSTLPGVDDSRRPSTLIAARAAFGAYHDETLSRDHFFFIQNMSFPENSADHAVRHLSMPKRLGDAANFLVDYITDFRSWIPAFGATTAVPFGTQRILTAGDWRHGVGSCFDVPDVIEKIDPLALCLNGISYTICSGRWGWWMTSNAIGRVAASTTECLCEIGWFVSHSAWNSLQHALHGNTVKRPPTPPKKTSFAPGSTPPGEAKAAAAAKAPAVAKPKPVGPGPTFPDEVAPKSPPAGEPVAKPKPASRGSSFAPIVNIIAKRVDRLITNAVYDKGAVTTLSDRILHLQTEGDLDDQDVAELERLQDEIDDYADREAVVDLSDPTLEPRRDSKVSSPPVLTARATSTVYRSWRAALLTWWSAHFERCVQEVVISSLISSLPDDTRLQVTQLLALSESGAVDFKKFEFAHFLEQMDAKYDSSQLQQDLKVQTEFDSLERKALTVLQYAQLILRYLPRVRAIDGYKPASTFARTLLVRAKLPNANLGRRLSELQKKQISMGEKICYFALIEWMITNIIIPEGHEQELVRTTMIEQVHADGHNRHRGRGGVAAAQTDHADADDDDESDDAAAAVYGGKGQVRQRKKGGKSGKSRKGDTQKGNFRQQHGGPKGGVQRDIAKTPKVVPPPARPPKSWDASKGDWQCAKCKHFNFLATSRAEGAPKNTHCRWCNVQKIPVVHGDAAAPATKKKSLFSDKKKKKKKKADAGIAASKTSASSEVVLEELD